MAGRPRRRESGGTTQKERAVGGNLEKSRPKIEFSAIRNIINITERPNVSDKVLRKLQARFPEIHRSVTDKKGSWGDVAKAVNTEFGTKIGSKNAIWLHRQAQKREGTSK